MDITEINKVANRKKITSEVENLRERVNRENRKIIKLRVAQDTAYWDVKEKLSQTVTNHEKLQQNMVELQMQYETVSGKYQEELRFRPETLNKLAGTRQICDVLEDYTERLRDTLSRCKADQVSLFQAYQKSGQVVRDLKDKQTHANEHSQLVIANLKEKISLITENNAQMMQLFTTERQRLECELQEAKTKLAEAGRLKEELLAAGREQNRELEAVRRDVQMKEECLNTVKREVNRMIQEYNAKIAAMDETIHKVQKDNKDLTSNKEALQQALSNQEAYTNSVLNEKNALQEKVADLENEVSKRDGSIKEMQETFQNANATNENLTMQITNMNQEKQQLLREINQKKELVAHLEIELQSVTRHLSSVENEKAEAEAAVTRALNEMKDLDARVQEMTAAGQELGRKLQEMEKEMETEREAKEKKLKQLSTALEEKERELTAKAGTISKLMGDVKHGLDVQTELDANLQKVKRDMETERKRMAERETQLVAKMEQLEIVIKGKEDEIRSKDQEFSKQITVVMELRGDKERLNKTIVLMQNKIDNIQKELNGSFSRDLTAADHDDNAVNISFNTLPTKTCEMSQQSLQLSPVFATPRTDHRARPNQSINAQDEIFNFFSDSSADGLDQREINRRFEAMSRGVPLPPVHHSELKKRRRAGTPTAQARFNFTQPNQKAEENIPLSEMKASAAMKKDKERLFFKHKPRRGNDGNKRSNS